MAKIADVYFAVDPWKIIEKGFDPAYSRVSESVFSLANESMGVRGCFDEGGSVDSLRGAYANGVYDVETLPRSYRGIVDKTHFMIPSAEWLMTEITLDGEKLDLGKVKFTDFERVLDMRAGTLKRSFVWETTTGKQLKLTFLRFTDMVDRERAFQQITFEPVNFSGDVTLVSGISFDVLHEGRQKCFWTDTRSETSGTCLMLQSRTTASGQEVFAGASLEVPDPDQLAASVSGKTASFTCPLHLVQGQAATVTKRVVVLFDGSEGEAL